MSSPSLGSFSSYAFELKAFDFLTFDCSLSTPFTFSFSLSLTVVSCKPPLLVASPTLLKMVSQLACSGLWAGLEACCCPCSCFTLAEPNTWFGSPWYCHGPSARTELGLWVLGVVGSLFTIPEAVPLSVTTVGEYCRSRSSRRQRYSGRSKRVPEHRWEVSVVRGSGSHCLITHWLDKLGQWGDKFLNKGFPILAGFTARNTFFW